MSKTKIREEKLKYTFLVFCFVGIQSFACSAYVISPGIRSDNSLTNIEQPPIIRDDKIRNDNLFVSVFIPRDKDLEEVFFDENNFASPNELLRNTLTALWEKARQTKNVILIQTENKKNNAKIRQIKSIHIDLKDCEPIKSINYEYAFIRFIRSKQSARSSLYPKLPESAYREEKESVAANFSMKEISTLRSIFIFNKECVLDSKAILMVTVETDEILTFKFQNAK